MSDSDLTLPPLDRDVEELLRCERERPSVEGAAVDRMWTLISAELAVAPVAGASSASPLGGVAAPAHVPAALAPGQVVAGIGRLALVKALPWMVASLGIGGVGGFVAEHRRANARVARLPPTTVRASQPAVPLPNAIPEVEVAAPATAVPSAAVPVESAPAPRARKHSPGAARDETLRGESAMLQQAEQALRSGDWSAALRQTEAYARQFPHGELVEENAYLGVRACLRGGDKAGARARLEEFRHRFPLSPLGKPAGD